MVAIVEGALDIEEADCRLPSRVAVLPIVDSLFSLGKEFKDVDLAASAGLEATLLPMKWAYCALGN